MAGDTAILSLDGSIDLATFSAALESFRMLLDGLSEFFAAGYKIDWEITGLRAGSALTAVRGIAESPEVVSSVITALDAVGEALEHRKAIPYGESVATAALNLTRLVDGRVHAVRLVTDEREYVLAGSPSAEPASQTPEIGAANESARALDAPVSSAEAFGAVEGTIRTLIDRGKLRFTLYDQFDRKVTCYLEEGQQDVAASLWGRRVVVEGWVQRDIWTGQPVAIRRITAITPVSEGEPMAWRKARGSVPREPDTAPAEDVIRRLRDA
jgi:hypothetical protein